ncbi:MAG: hypothetical protein B6U76_00945 [Desulfurococcales archaeon ex4484_217_2]|nr:MAG: hypothetical protein B6U76_00945 [Desulfurococcales archaeon ex4484_217_2]
MDAVKLSDIDKYLIVDEDTRGFYVDFLIVDRDKVVSMVLTPTAAEKIAETLRNAVEKLYESAEKEIENFSKTVPLSPFAITDEDAIRETKADIAELKATTNGLIEVLEGEE